MQKVFVKVFKAIIHVIYAAPGSNKLSMWPSLENVFPTLP